MDKGIPELSKKVMEITQEIGLSKRFIQEIQTWQERVNPEEITIENFNSLLVQTHNEKINIQKDMRNLIMQFKNTGISYKDLCLEGEEFLKKSISIEPRFFAVSSCIKLHIDNAIESAIKNYGNNISDEEISLLSTPSSANYYTNRFLDTQKYLTSRSEEDYLLLKRRYGNNFLQSRWFKQQVPNFNLYKKIQDIEKERVNKKMYFLIEIKIPNAKLIDNLLTIDNILEKFLQQNNLFLHDIFLAFLINHPEQDITQIKDIKGFSKYVKPSVIKALSYC